MRIQVVHESSKVCGIVREEFSKLFIVVKHTKGPIDLIFETLAWIRTRKMYVYLHSTLS